MPPKQPKELIRKELTTCQNPGCGKSRLDEGVTLSRCAGCKIALYCVSFTIPPKKLHLCNSRLHHQSKECQKAGWPAHKTTCKLNQRSQEVAAVRMAQAPNQGDILKRLRAFCTKHRPSLAEYGIRSLDLPLDTTRSLREVVLLRVKSVPTATRPELSFRAIDAEVVPIAYFGPTLEAELQAQLQDFANQQKRIGKLGGIMVMVLESGTNLTNVCPVGFGKDVLTLKTGQPWKEPLINTLNKGIVY